MTDRVLLGTHLTVEQFEQFIDLPENTENRFELIDGELLEVPSNPYSSAIAALIIAALINFAHPRKLGHVTGEQGGYVIGGEYLAPDVAFISYTRQRELVKEGFNPNPPDLAIEVVSPGDTPSRITKKQATYTKAGVTSWWVYPERKQVEVRRPGQAVETFGMDDVLTGDGVLDSFTLSVRYFLED